MNNPRRISAVTHGEAMSLLAGVSLGRLVFTRNAMPAIRPASHLVESGVIIARSHDGSVVVPASGGRIAGPAPVPVAGPVPGPVPVAGAVPVASAGRETVVAYQADVIEADSRLGWSVVITGPATPVTDPAEIARYATVLDPWTTAGEGQLVRVHPGIVSGYRLID